MPPPTIRTTEKQSYLQQAFTLIELSIVLVIIGLLVGVVVIGQSLIEVARVNQAVSMHAEFLAAWNTFKVTYNAIPGDIPNATMFWGVDDSCPLLSGSPTTSGTCNGNGDGKINWYSYAQGGTTVPSLPDSPAEATLVFDHLMRSNLLNLIVGKEVSPVEMPYYVYPKFRMQSRASWFVGSPWPGQADLYPSGTVYQGTDMKGNALQTAVNMTNAGIQPLAAVASPIMVQMIDQKLDDGLPRKGKFQASNAVPMSSAAFDSANFLSCLASDGAGGFIYNGTITYDACRFLYSLDQ